ncbi:bifunctional DNA-formamidopyrimidine glycosylase/DNA-(apurinic or apyrimidinic site) lyase [Corynebacterium timonense]|uniref:Formamidopyrimidine-DNA glycosylase n=1 Tax=Corynebacterium timonense TaxID=441500 RepID=A0A1H1MWC2_9CORY|nr:bifunctional DNA-formamidopyrimidine glycosylase/DNA-(apurinic or apyrimidinic site) lyase [Corynebacterium timonense]SDR90927.1 DNA-(apurinic or apyrimidinic site) lyase [Corynebacterium timonense]
MPELPEVEVVRRGLDEHLVGRTFGAVEVLHPRAVRGNDVDLAGVLPGLTVTGTGRRGKFMWLTLSDGAALVVHLRMSGQMLVGQPGQVAGPHVRIRASISELELTFVDQRTFGSWQYAELVDDPLTASPHRIPATVTHVAPDPFEDAFDPVEAARRVRRKKSAIKTVLLDQSVVSGIGSIYADEAMWAAGVKPTRRAASLRQRDAVRLLTESRAVMARALEQGGTSFDSLYVNVNGASGYFSRSLNAYGRAGAPCRACGTEMRRVVVNGRSSHYCPACQTA